MAENIRTICAWTNQRNLEPETQSYLGGTEPARAFLPTEDFETSKSFYLALGFMMVLEGDVAIFATGESEIILTRFYQKQYAENFMMQLLVDDLDAWWDRISSLDLPGRFGVAAPKEPSMQP